MQEEKKHTIIPELQQEPDQLEELTAKHLHELNRLEEWEYFIIDERLEELDISDDKKCTICEKQICELDGAYKLADAWVCSESCAEKIEKKKSINFKYR